MKRLWTRRADVQHSPRETQNPEKFVTEIYYPVKKE